MNVAQAPVVPGKKASAQGQEEVEPGYILVGSMERGTIPWFFRGLVGWMNGHGAMLFFGVGTTSKVKSSPPK